ncbi:MAG TPA: hypothetical protein VL463_17490, partial [Kofleriaceae bacterium]|nr:hypothetical protein [Kofleriaceae bacterium]
KAEMQTCIQWLTDPSKGVGVHAEEIIGFRTPFLLYSDKTYVALHDLGFRYDCTIEDGFQGDRDASSDTWPYTLDHGSPADGKIGAHAGLWELPVYPVVVPPDDKCAQYGVPSGLRAKLMKIDPTFDVSTGKISGLDYNLWIIYRMTKAEFVATLEYTLDQHLAGNRAPFMIGAHPDLYSIEPPDDPTPNSTYQDRRAALAEFLDYALSKPDVRVVPNRVILDWLRAPVPL